MQLKNSSLKRLSLAYRIGEQTQSIETLSLLHRFLEIKFPLLKSTNSNA